MWSAGRVLPNFFKGHSGHMAEPAKIGFLDLEEKWFEIQGFANFTAKIGFLDLEEKWFEIQGFANFTTAHFVAKCHTVNSSQNPISSALTVIFSVITY